MEDIIKFPNGGYDVTICRKQDILNCIDVLLEGRFVMKLHDDRLHYVGSSNQRIIDVKKSLEEGKVVLYIDNSNIGDSDKATVVQCAVNS